MKQVILTCFIAITVCGSLSAQSVVSPRPEQCLWKFGDNPAWAAPNLDDTGWQPFSQSTIPVLEPHVWSRCHVDLGALRGSAHPAIQIGIAGAYQLFVNGVRIGGAGNMGTGFYSMNTIRQYPLPAATLQAQPVTIALRITFRHPIVTNPLEIHAGDLEALAGRRASLVLAHNPTWQLANAVFFGVLGLMLLGLFYYDRSRRELLYLSIICVDRANFAILAYCSAALMNYSVVLQDALNHAGDIVFPVVLVLFFFALARRRVPRFYWLALAVVVAQFALLGSTILLTANAALRLMGRILSVNRYTLLVAVAQIANCGSPFVAFWPYRQISLRMRPLAVLCMLWAGAGMLWYAVEATAMLLKLPSLFYTWQLELTETIDFVTACVLVGLLALLFRDQRRVTEERAMLAGEMQAAGEIQRMLAPAKIETAPGLHINVAFHPVRDVGGDFYFCRVLSDGSQRVLVGDVSGHGPAAAMSATLLLGAAAARDSDSPSVLLCQLNRVLHESHVGGFATCLCADLTAAGEVILANAGHLPPYCNSREIELCSSLPLGIAGTAEYSDTTLQLAPGETLTFVSDGVIEARDAKGELLGFERARALSIKSAEAIAQAAQNWGQEDDITVLTLTFAPAEVLHA